MEQILPQLALLRKQLVMQQSCINESLSVIDTLIISQIGNHSKEEELIPTVTNSSFRSINKIPNEITTKRGKLLYILSEADKPMSAKEIKNRLIEYGEDLPNVDQSLVNLEGDRLISSIREGGRKYYFVKK